MRVLLLAGLLALAGHTVRAAEPAIVAAEGAAAAGDYRAAVRHYEQALQSRGFSAPLLFNLGNAYLRLGQPARAILQYERALLLAPDSAVIESNLATARQRAGIAAPALSSWQAAARHFSFDTYLWVGLVALWVLCAALVLVCLGRAARRCARPLIVAAAVMLCVSADAAALCWSDQYRAVVQEPTATRLAPAAAAAANGAVRAGELVWIQDQYRGFDFVRAADGHSGWLPAGSVTVIRAAHP